MFSDVREATVVCGHTHMQFQRDLDGLKVVNAGSVGMPYGQPGAHWLRLSARIEFMRTSYDATFAARRIEDTGYPDAAVFAEQMSAPAVRARNVDCPGQVQSA